MSAWKASKHARHTSGLGMSSHADAHVHVGLQIPLTLAGAPQQAQALAHQKLLRAQR